MTTSHRKTVRHFESERCVHELTFSCYRRRPLLTGDTRRCLLAESITRATAQHGYSVLALVFMPEHVHLLVLAGHNEKRVPCYFAVAAYIMPTQA